MDITLERILSLIASDKNGRFKRNAAADFAEKVGVAANLPAEWKAGRNKSYRAKIGDIAAAYNVSSEWLLGQTDIKEKPIPLGDELDLSALSEAKRDFILQCMDLSDDQIQALTVLLQRFKAGG